MSSIYARQFAEIEAKIQTHYDEIRAEVGDDIQRAGHQGEGTWVQVLRPWLPSTYEVVTRKYIVPEEGSDEFEMDIIIVSPGYPKELSGDARIMAGGVAAAFSTRLTLDADGIDDAFKRAVKLRRGLKKRYGSPRSEMLGAFPVGMLAHSHDWKRPNSTPLENVSKKLALLDQSEVIHPREALDLLCVADLGTWAMLRAPYLPPQATVLMPGATDLYKSEGCSQTSMTTPNPAKTEWPVGSLVAHLLGWLSYNDPTMRPFADSLRLAGLLGEGSGKARIWNLHDVFSDAMIQQLHIRGLGFGGEEWATAFF